MPQKVSFFTRISALKMQYLENHWANFAGPFLICSVLIRRMRSCYATPQNSFYKNIYGHISCFCRNYSKLIWLTARIAPGLTRSILLEHHKTFLIAPTDWENVSCSRRNVQKTCFWGSIFVHFRQFSGFSADFSRTTEPISTKLSTHLVYSTTIVAAPAPQSTLPRTGVRVHLL